MMWAKVSFQHNKFHFSSRISAFGKEGVVFCLCSSPAWLFASKKVRLRPRLKDRCKKCESRRKYLEIKEEWKSHEPNLETCKKCKKLKGL